MINPRGVKIVANTVGFFIANDAEEVRRANVFCKVNVGFFIANDAEEVRRANVFCKVNVSFFIANDAPPRQRVLQGTVLLGGPSPDPPITR